MSGAVDSDAIAKPGELMHLTFESLAGADDKMNREAWFEKFRDEFTSYQLAVAVMKYDDKALTRRVRMVDIEHSMGFVENCEGLRDDLNDRIKLIDAVIARMMVVIDRVVDEMPDEAGTA